MAEQQGSFRASWADALRVWRQRGGTGNPRRGTSGYDEVAAIYKEINPTWKPKAGPAKPRASRVAKLAQELNELGLEVKHRDVDGGGRYEGGGHYADPGQAEPRQPFAQQNVSRMMQQQVVRDAPPTIQPSSGVRRLRGPRGDNVHALGGNFGLQRGNPPEVIASIGSPPPAPGAPPRVPAALTADEADAILASLEGAGLSDQTLQTIVQRLGL